LVLTATALPEWMRTPMSESPAELSPTPLPAWCKQLLSPANPPQGVLRVAFVKDRDVWIWDEGQTPRRLTRQGNVIQVYLSDDGQVLAYLRAGSGDTVELWRIDSSGQEARQAISAAGFDRMRTEPKQLGVIPFDLAWIPGTHRLAFNTYPLLPGEAIWIYVPDDLWVFDLDSLRTFALLPKGQGGHFSFSPDGKLAAVFTPAGLKIMKANGAILIKDALEGFQALGLGEYYNYPSLQWAPDSQALIVAIPSGPDPFQPQAGAVIWRVPVDGSQPQLVKEIPAYLAHVAFSPDLTRLAYFHQPDQRSSGRELHLIELDGDEDFLFLRGEVMERFQWLPDSQHFLYWEIDAWQPQLAHICQEAGEFPAFAVRSDIHWVDAQRFLFLSGGDGAWELNLGTVDGDLTPIAELGESSAFAFRVVGAE
jgi:dipeptidyl aminopeptidase/acylaminoacyl peptidase